MARLSRSKGLDERTIRKLLGGRHRGTASFISSEELRCAKGLPILDSLEFFPRRLFSRQLDGSRQEDFISVQHQDDARKGEDTVTPLQFGGIRRCILEVDCGGFLKGLSFDGEKGTRHCGRLVDRRAVRVMCAVMITGGFSHTGSY